MLYERRRQLTRIAVLIFVVIVLIIIGDYIYTYLTTGVITVSSKSTNVVKIEQIGTNIKNPVNKISQGSLSMRLKPGNYEVFAYSQNDLYGSSRIVVLKARQNLKYNLNPLPVSLPEPVYGGAVSGLYADDTHLSFVPLAPSTTNSAIDDGYMIQSNQGSVSQPFPNTAFRNIQWVNSSLGIGEDSSNNIYSISGSNLSQISLPFNASGSQLSSAIDSSGNVYVSDGHNLYAGTTSGGFMKIYTAPGGIISRLTANSGGVAAIIHSAAPEDSNVSGDALVYIPKSGKVISKTSQNLSSVFWSSDGKYLLAESGTVAYIYDVGLHLDKTLTINGAGNYTWLDDNTILYSVGDQIWSIKINTNQSNIVTTLSLKQNVESIYLSHDGSYLYFTEDNGQQTELFRVGLRGQQTNDNLTSLSVFLPTLVNLCSLNYVNFNKPTVLLTYPVTVDLQTCIAAAQKELQTFNLNPADFQYIFMP